MMLPNPDSAVAGAATDPMRLFERAVRNAPDRISVVGADGELTFAGLDAATARLAASLISRGVTKGGRVGVCLPRGARLLVSLLAVWRVGAAYVPLDSRYPHDRLTFMAEDAAIKVLIAENGSWAPADVEILDPGDLTSAPGTTAPDASPAPAVTTSPLDLAYAIFTSGTTGTPKAVAVTRGGVAALIAALEDVGAYDAAPRVVAWNASVSFDASVQQWTRVCRGDTVIVISEDDRTDPERMRALLDRHAVTDLDLTPSHWELLRTALLTLRETGALRLFMGGEPVPDHTWRELAGATADGVVEALNLYGPTECTVDATTTWIVGDRPHIGRSLPGLSTYVLDDRLRQVPNGADGELYIAGPQLAQGYLARGRLTATRFVADPYGSPGTRMYRTGDVVRRTPEGTLGFVGRADRQLKFRGYRIEPSEIELVLRTHPGLASVAVMVRSHDVSGDHLVAFCAPSGAQLPPAAELLAHAARQLPDFMVPTDVVVLRHLPLTVNGKLDVAAIADAWPPATTPVEAAESDQQTASASERLIASVWSEVLGREHVAPDDNFFALGGHSLLALRAVARLKKNLGIAVAVRDVYQHPQLRDLAGYVDALAAHVKG